MEMEEELKSALQRVVNEKQYKYIPQVEQALTLARQKERILATQIFGGLGSSSSAAPSTLVLCDKVMILLLLLL